MPSNILPEGGNAPDTTAPIKSPNKNRKTHRTEAALSKRVLRTVKRAVLRSQKRRTESAPATGGTASGAPHREVA